jgi:hypothetical protein
MISTMMDIPIMVEIVLPMASFCLPPFRVSKRRQTKTPSRSKDILRFLRHVIGLPRHLQQNDGNHACDSVFFSATFSDHRTMAWFDRPKRSLHCPATKKKENQSWLFAMIVLHKSQPWFEK